jgi:hypothetical protein
LADDATASLQTSPPVRSYPKSCFFFDCAQWPTAMRDASIKSDDLSAAFVSSGDKPECRSAVRATTRASLEGGDASAPLSPGQKGPYEGLDAMGTKCEHPSGPSKVRVPLVPDYSATTVCCIATSIQLRGNYRALGISLHRHGRALGHLGALEAAIRDSSKPLPDPLFANPSPALPRAPLPRAGGKACKSIMRAAPLFEQGRPRTLH